MLDQLVSEGVAAIAVCFLHAYANDRHERRVAEIARELPSAIVGLAVVRRRRRAWRVPALRDDLRQCLRAAADGPLCRAPRARFASARLSRRSSFDAFRGRPGLAGDGEHGTDPVARVRSGRRRPCHRAVRRSCRQVRRDFVRHGWDHGKGLSDRERPHRGCACHGSGARASLQARLGPADQGAGHRHDRDRRRRRFDCADRRSGPAAGRSAFRGRGSRTGLLRQWRHRADRHRCQSRARLLRSGLLSRRPHATRRRGCADGTEDDRASRWA